ncbi:MAG: type II toxin-antitoxin system Phd/YefM family antitoxin [Alphaproteobacteria bacterium]|nr:type II toxin-antitoxin system Phd/YefM family antitoxin [Alphaproteobacteria bacterium]
MIIPAAEFQRNIGTYQDRALTAPVFVTRNGRERTVLLSVDEYRRLKRRDREVLAVEHLDATTVAAIAAAEVPAEFAHLDAELEP